ncbi:DUF1636 domain-containing protein [Sphingomonas sp. BGYR3]|uniref:DUF1636 domain-containing protein n=1 Tax=Sphingomonas sp. BGYR3 TaxID=2975483 RepID=UPI0021A5D069|nr:DUF1636 domain-containing protein [Sphingomonas sp. BGYR3]
MKDRVRANWSDAILVCAKCSKKLDGGFGDKGRQPLAKALRKHLGTGKGRKGRLGIVEVKCLGVCPRGAVTVINGREPGVWQLVPGGTDLDDVADALGLGTQEGGD